MRKTVELTDGEKLIAPIVRDVRAASTWSIVPALFAASATAAGQEVIVIPDRVACGECVIEVEAMLSIGGRVDDTLNIGYTGRLPVDSHGRVYFHSYDHGGPITVFDRGGRRVGVIGRDGRGPGEFVGSVGVHITPEDSLYAFDSGLRRLSVFDPAWELVRTAQVELVANGDGYFTREGSEFVGAEIGRGASTFGYPIHRIARSGRYMRSFGGDHALEDQRLRPLLRRSIAPAAGGGTWVAHAFQYVIERYDRADQLTHLVSRSPPWFPEIGGVPMRPASLQDEPPYAMINGIQEDEQGRLWILSWVAADDWQAVLRTQRRMAPSTSGFWDTMIEVLDPQRAVVVARTRVEARALGFSAPGLFYSYSDEELYPQLTLWRLILSTSTTGGLR